MDCPRCFREVNDGTEKCPYCGFDIYQREKLVNMSNILYNKGLLQARKRNLSGAVFSLEESLRINKNNTEARNLLGLVYLETGLVGDAVKQWIISINLKKRENYAAERYLDDIQTNSREYEQLSEAVKMYNIAIEYVGRGNDDMAIIQLKRAVELSPRFVNALNFLAFCYLVQRNSREALALVERVLTIDVDNETALRYYKTIIGKKMKSAAIVSRAAVTPKEQAQSAEQPFAWARTLRTEKRTTMFSDILFFSIGVICAIAVMYVLVIPDISSRENEKSAELNEEITALNKKYDTDTADMAGQIEELEGQIENLNETVADRNEQIAHYEKIQVVASAGRLLEAGNILGAAEAIHTVDLADLPIDVLEQAEGIKAATYSQTAAMLFGDGVAEYNAGNFESAKELLERALNFATESNTSPGDINYYLENIERELSNS